MPKTDILKLIFHHDQRLDDLAPAAEEDGSEDLLASFMKPDPTYSTLYFSATDLSSQEFGVNTLSKYDEFIAILEKGLGETEYHTSKGKYSSLKEAVDVLEMNEALVVSDDEVETGIIHSFTRKMLRDVLEKGWIIMYKREARDGFDLHFFTKKNIYTNFFYLLQAMLPDAFRFFSINGKRVSSEKQFYFETWKLDKPPHGFEEVFPESVL